MTYLGYIGASILLIVAIIIALVAEAKVSSAYSKYSKVNSKSGWTGKELAEKIIDHEYLNVKINGIKGKLTDNYNSATKTLNISSSNLNSTSIAALGVVAHECGHAIQDAKGYKMLKVRHSVIKVTNAVSKLLFPLLIVGLILDLLYIGGVIGMVFIWVAVGFYGMSVLANLVTLPVELDASNRAMSILENFGVMDNSELAQTKKVLSAAALTYLASLLVSLAYFLRFLFIALSYTDRR